MSWGDPCLEKKANRGAVGSCGNGSSSSHSLKGVKETGARHWGIETDFVLLVLI